MWTFGEVFLIIVLGLGVFAILQVFLLYVAFNFYVSYQRSLQQTRSVELPRHEPVQVALVTPELHRGLILPLQPYHRMGSEYELAELMDLLASETHLMELRAQIYRSNWASLMVAIEYHAPRLERCWLLNRKEDIEAEQEAVRRLIRSLAGEKVIVESSTIPDAGDLAAVAQYVHTAIYENLQGFEFTPGEVIADISKATPAVSNGMLLGSLRAGGAIQYLRHDARLFDNDTGLPLPIEVIREKGLIKTVRY